MQLESSKTERIEIDFSGIIKANPTGFITRENIGEATGGLISRKYIANLDSKGEGIEERFKIGRKVVYPVSAVVDFLKNRVQAVV